MNFWKQQREKLGVSQRKLAAMLGLSNNTVSLWESEDKDKKAIPELFRAAKLGEIFGCGRDRVEREIVKLHRLIAADAEPIAA